MTAPATKPAQRTLRLATLGDLLGPLVYMGTCFGCCRQFPSRNERVYAVTGSATTYCRDCGDRLIAAQ